MTVPLRIVVVRVDHDLSCERRHWNVAVILERHGDDDEIAGGGRLDGRGCAGTGPELDDQRRQRLRAARVADHDVIAVRERQPRDLTADVPGADESDRSS